MKSARTAFSAFLQLACATALLCSSSVFAAETLRVLNWSSYIAPDVIKGFESRYNAKVDYVEYESVEDFGNRFLEANSHFDVIFPASRMLPAMVDAKLVRPLDTKKLPNLAGLNGYISKEFRAQNSDDWYGVPYMWGTTGLGVNKALLSNAGVAPQEMSWALLFDPAVRAKAAKCGIIVLNERDELFAAALRYKGQSINTVTATALNDAGTLIKEAMPDIRYLRSDGYVDALLSGEACVVMGYSGDILTAIDDQPQLSYVIPEQGAAMWIDVMAIPASSEHEELAYAFINYLMEAQNAATNSSYLKYPTAMASALPLVERSVQDRPEVYPSVQVLSKLETMRPMPADTNRVLHRLWTKAVCSSGKYCSAPVNSLF